MRFLFASPLFFLIALLAIPLLVVIYWLRTRPRRITVSSLFLWIRYKNVREGGLRFHRFSAPLLFFLELLVISLLIAAAARPMMPSLRTASPLLVILDDSFSMQAGKSLNNSRTLAMAALEKEINRKENFPLSIILAGETPKVIGQSIETRQEMSHMLKQWECCAFYADIEKAIALAFELTGKQARILVISDREPLKVLSEQSKIQWWAFGASLPNVGFINAARSVNDEKCLLEIENFSPHPAKTALRITDNKGKLIQNYDLQLNPSQRSRQILQVASPKQIFYASLEQDALECDNQIILLPESRPKVRAQLHVKDDSLRSLMEQTLKSTEMAILSSVDSHIIISDQNDEQIANNQWLLQIISAKDAVPYIGPFIFDHNHPITQGLSLGGVVWACSNDKILPGNRLIMAGNIPLLTELENEAEQRKIYMGLSLELSNFHHTPNWPIFMWNLLQWRSQAMPGLTSSNVRVGNETSLHVSSSGKSVEIKEPGGAIHNVVIHGQSLPLRPQRPGIYEIRSDEDKYYVAANMLSVSESNLTQCCSGRWGSWITDQALQQNYDDISWLFLLAALIILLVIALLSKKALVNAPVTV